LTLLTFGLSLGTMLATTLLFLASGRERAFSIGILAANRNVGIMLTATGFAVPELAWLYFGLAQFPIYLLPLLLKPLARRLGRG
jgi:BASS family bile acid:Na+ symporter